MSDVTVEQPKVAVTFEVKLGLKNYSNVMARAWVEQHVDEDNPESVALATATGLARDAVNAALSDFGGIDVVIPTLTATRTSNGQTVEIPVEEAVANVVKAFPGTEQVDPADDYDPTPDESRDIGRPEGLRIAGKANGEIPAWLVRAAKRKGTTAVFDNRGPDGSAPPNKRPWFVDADDKSNAFWPPRER